MGTFLLVNVKVKKKKKSWCAGIVKYDRNLNPIDTKLFDKSESVKVELEFVSNGDTSDFSREDIAVILNKLIKELKKE